MAFVTVPSFMLHQNTKQGRTLPFRLKIRRIHNMNEAENKRIVDYLGDLEILPDKACAL